MADALASAWRAQSTVQAMVLVSVVLDFAGCIFSNIGLSMAGSGLFQGEFPCQSLCAWAVRGLTAALPRYSRLLVGDLLVGAHVPLRAQEDRDQGAVGWHRARHVRPRLQRAWRILRRP